MATGTVLFRATPWSDGAFALLVVSALWLRMRARGRTFLRGLIEGSVSQRDVWLSMLLGELILLAATLGYLLATGARPASVGLRPPVHEVVVPGLVALTFVVLVSLNRSVRRLSMRQRGVAPLSGVDGRALAAALCPRNWSGWAVFTAVSLVVVLAEELFFRGFLLTWLTRDGSLPIGLLVSSVVFGLVHAHYPLRQRAGLALFGFAFGLLFIGGLSLLLPMIAHLFVNVRAVLYASQLPVTETPSPSPGP